MNKNLKNLKKKKAVATATAFVILGVGFTNFNFVNINQNITSVHAAVATTDHVRSEWGPSFSLDGLILHDGQYAFCMQFGVKSPSGQNYEQTITNFESNKKIKALLTHGYPTHASGLQKKYGISDRDAVNATQWAMHAIADEIGFPGIKPYPVSKFMSDAPNNAAGRYGKELLNLALAENIPNIQINVAPASTNSVYDKNLNLLVSDQFYTANVSGSNITFGNLPTDVFVINENGQKVTSVVSGQKFKLATSNLRLDSTFNDISVEAHVQETAPIFYSFPGSQTIVQTSAVDPLKKINVSQSFKPAVGDIEFEKVDKTANVPLSNIEFNLFDNNKNIVGKSVSDANGKVVFKNILLGEYNVQEVSVKGDGLVDTDKLYPVNVSAGTTVDLNGIKEVQNEETTTIIKKSDLTNGKFVKSAHLQIIDKDGKIVTEWDTTNEEKTINKLAEGEYTLRETYSPTRYQYSIDMQFSVKEDGSISKIEMKDDRTRLIINKQDGNGKPLAGAEFGVYTNDGKLTKMLDRDGKEIDAIVTSGKDGKAIFEGLEFGEYVVKEIESPAGYTKNSDIHVTIGQKSETVQNFVNYKTPEISTVNGVLPRTGGAITSITDSGLGFGVIGSISAGLTGVGFTFATLRKKMKK